MKVLLVDDDADLRTIGSLSLTTVARWTVVLAASGQEAVELARQERPNVILLDAMMPRLNGAGTFALLRAHEATAAIPIIFMTAKAQTRDLEQYLSLGAAGVISKPFDPMTLAARIVDILDSTGGGPGSA